MGFTSAFIDKNAFIVMLLFGIDRQGEQQFTYLAVPVERLKAFSQAMQSGETNLYDYGMLIVSGRGIPDQHIQQQMHEQFGVEYYYPPTPNTAPDPPDKPPVH